MYPLMSKKNMDTPKNMYILDIIFLNCVCSLGGGGGGGGEMGGVFWLDIFGSNCFIC